VSVTLRGQNSPIFHLRRTVSGVSIPDGQKRVNCLSAVTDTVRGQIGSICLFVVTDTVRGQKGTICLFGVSVTGGYLGYREVLPVSNFLKKHNVLFDIFFYNRN
jgi:hypothetical protein